MFYVKLLIPYPNKKLYFQGAKEKICLTTLFSLKRGLALLKPYNTGNQKILDKMAIKIRVPFPLYPVPKKLLTNFPKCDGKVGIRYSRCFSAVNSSFTSSIESSYT
ncbi:MAG: hypothetical protein RLZZ184_977 [Cyanobacteriota bacterium]